MAFNVFHKNIISPTSPSPSLQPNLSLTMPTPSRPNASLSPWNIHDNVRTASAKGDESPSIKAINFKDTDMGMTTTLTARDLSDANYPEFVGWVQDFLQACWSVAGKTLLIFLAFY